MGNISNQDTSEQAKMGEWKQGLCGCFNNIGLCVITYFVPCYTAGKVAEQVGEDCLICGLIQLVPIADIIFGAKIRQKVREQKGIDGSFIGDLFTFCCCYCCALVQEGQETNALGSSTTQTITRE